ncbi:MAG: D-2-hydroxyacid dehydrogenase [Chloroflexota bacterium]
MNILMIPNPVVLGDLSDAHRQQILEAAGPGSRIVVARTAEDEINHAPEADVVLGQLRRAAFVVAPKIQWLQTLAAGVDMMMFPEFVNSNIPLVSEKGIVGNQLSEHAFALLLALTRGVASIARRRGWIEDRPAFRRHLWELAGMTMGVVGLGGTGVAVARRADAFGMRVIATDPEPVEQPPFVAQLWKTDHFPQLLEESDVVTVCAPLTPETNRMFNREAFQRMRNHAILVNVTRGEIVDEASLIEALQGGMIGGAALDVTPREPMPADSPLWAMDNVLMASHTAGASPHRGNRSVERFCDNLRRWRRGEPLQGVIDKHKGY